MAFKITKGIINWNYKTFCKLSTNKTRGHDLKLYKQRSCLNVRLDFISQRIHGINYPTRLLTVRQYCLLKRFVIAFTANQSTAFRVYRLKALSLIQCTIIIIRPTTDSQGYNHLLENGNIDEIVLIICIVIKVNGTCSLKADKLY